MFESKFFGKSPIKRPTCPFCESIIERPLELITRRPGEMPVGACSCGAVYACDETGHNQGSALIEALVFGCNMDWDLAWGLLPEEDYFYEIVDNYDYQTHLIIPGGFYERRKISGVLFFVRLHPDVLELTAQGIKRNLDRAVSPEDAPGSQASGQKKSLTKKQVEEFIQDYYLKPILDAARHDKKIIRYIQRLLYSGDRLLRQRAADALGKTCAVIGEKSPGTVSKLLQGLFYSITDTAAFSPGSFEAIGEIISSRTDLYAGYTAQLYQFLADETRKAQALQAIAKIAKADAVPLRKHTFHFFSFLEDPDPDVRGYAAWLMGNLRAKEAKEDLEKLTQESHEIEIYSNGKLEKKTIGQVASEAISRLTVS